MKLSPFTIKHLSRMVSGDTEGWPYRSGPDLVKLFNKYGFMDIYEQGFPTRYVFAGDKLRIINGTDIIRELLKDLLDPRNWMDSQKELSTIDDCAAQVNELIKHDNLEMVKHGLFYKACDLTGSIIAVDLPFRKAADNFEIAIEEQISKCRYKITSGDYGGAITNARSLVEALLTSIEKELDPNAPEPDGDLIRLYTRVRGLLNLDPSRKDISDALKQVLTGLTSIVHGLATMRNKMSDAHATSYKPERHHAKLAVNAAKTVTDFMFEAMAYQKSDVRIKTKQ